MNIYLQQITFNNFFYLLFLVILTSSCNNKSQEKIPLRIVEQLNIGESKNVELTNGEIVNLKLIDIEVTRDSLRNAVRSSNVRVSVDGEVVTLNSGNYNLPVTVGKVQIDNPAIKAYYGNNRRDPWKLDKDARFRLWPKDSPYMNPGTFVYPVKAKWFETLTQSGNEPTYVDWGENISNNSSIYYHESHDFGGAELMDEVLSATDGVAVFVCGDTLESYKYFRSNVGSDDIYIIDDRGWYFRYSHLDSVETNIKPGTRVKKGQRISFMGKTGGSGGWVHLHFGIEHIDQSTGKWVIEEAYPYLWEAYTHQYNPDLLAVARPHKIAWTGQEVTLEGTKSRSLTGEIVSYEWDFYDGTKANGAIQKRSYENSGEYSEILKVTDSNGNVDFDFAIVQVYDRDKPNERITVMHPSYHPSLNIKPGDPVTFLVRSFNTDFGEEVWDFGDGTPLVTTRSKVDRKNVTKGKYAETIHSFSDPGHYIVSIERSNEEGIKAYGHLHVFVENTDPAKN